MIAIFGEYIYETKENRRKIGGVPTILQESDMSVRYGQTNLPQALLFWHHEALPSDAKQ